MPLPKELGLTQKSPAGNNFSATNIGKTGTTASWKPSVPSGKPKPPPKPEEQPTAYGNALRYRFPYRFWSVPATYGRVGATPSFWNNSWYRTMTPVYHNYTLSRNLAPLQSGVARTSQQEYLYNLGLPEYKFAPGVGKVPGGYNPYQQGVEEQPEVVIPPDYYYPTYGYGWGGWGGWGGGGGKNPYVAFYQDLISWRGV